MEIQLIIGPFIGAIIRLITNGIAIKMIFRPLYAKYLWEWKLPFTPGLIPKEKGKIERLEITKDCHKMIKTYQKKYRERFTMSSCIQI